MFFEDVIKLQRELDNIFGREFYPHSTFGRGTFPAINIFEKDDVLTLMAEMPGISKEDIDIKLQGDVISLSGERKLKEDENVNYHRRERDYGRFHRQFKLPYRINSEKVEAKMENGVLTLSLPKDEAEKPKLINVR